jgi:hypothetical protein
MRITVSFNPLWVFQGNTHTFDTDNITTGDLGGVISTLEHIKKQDMRDGEVYLVGDPITPLKEMYELRLKSDWKKHDAELLKDSQKYKYSPDAMSANSI